MSSDDHVPLIDCDNCMAILEYLNGKDEVDSVTLDGAMRTGGSTTTSYHVKEHLEKQQFVATIPRGTFRKKLFVKITAKGRKSLEKTRDAKKEDKK